MMKRIYFSIILPTFILLALNSCTKNKLDDVVLEKNIYEEWSQIAPFDVTVSGGVGIGPANINWSMKPEYAALLPSNESYSILLYKDGVLRAILQSNRVSFNDSSGFQSSHYYQLSILYSDGHESPKTSPLYT